MTAPLVLQLTDAGTAAVQAASGSDPTVIAASGLRTRPLTLRPRSPRCRASSSGLPVTSGEAAAANIAPPHRLRHFALKSGQASGLGLFLADGTLFAVYTAPQAVHGQGQSAPLRCWPSTSLFAADIAGNIAYGNATFTYPPATEAMRGVAELAAQAEVDAGTDDLRIVTPKKLAARLVPVTQGIADEAAARTNGDNALGDALANEAAPSARASGDAALQGQVETLAALDHIIQQSLTENGGYIVYASGRKETWGKLTIAKQVYATFNLPVEHTAWVNVSFAINIEGGNIDINQNTGITAINGAPPTSITLWNADNRTVTVWLRTIGV